MALVEIRLEPVEADLADFFFLLGRPTIDQVDDNYFIY